MSLKKPKSDENLNDNAPVPADGETGDAKPKKKTAAKPAVTPGAEPAAGQAEAEKHAKKPAAKSAKPKAEKAPADDAETKTKKTAAPKPRKSKEQEALPEPPKPVLSREEKSKKMSRFFISVSKSDTAAPGGTATEEKKTEHILPGGAVEQVAKPAAPAPQPAKPAALPAKPAVPPAHPAKPAAPGAHPAHPAAPGAPPAKPAMPAAQPARPANPSYIAKPGGSYTPGKPAPLPARPAVRPAVPSSPAKPAAKPAVPPAPAKPAAAPAAAAAPKSDSVKELPKITVSTQMIVRELAEKIGVKPTDFIKKLMGMGVFATINQRLDPDVATLIAADYGFDLEIVPIFDEETAEVEEKEDPGKLKHRSPIVTIMGHVDHGKTTLLDAFRESNVVDSEAGQITQHIGAYMVKTARGMITILDTPGHEAFTAMRAHGVKITDIVILVVSAVDGVMPQTLEAINHAKAANVPIIVAINKMDLPTANSQEIKQRLASIGLNPEDWGGKTVMVEISAKKRTNLDKLLEMVAIQAEMMELKANPDALGSGIVIESRLDPKMGMLATVIAVNGTIRVGDPFVVGTSHGKVRALINDRGVRLEKIGPGEPSGLLGISGEVPHAGDTIKVYKNEKEARHVAEKRKLHKREDALIHQKHVSLLSLKSQVDQKLLKNLNIVLKTDVFGSLQAIKDSLERLSTHEVAIRILHSGVGNITESDVLLAKASDAVIFGFHVDAETKVEEEAKSAGVELRTYQIIYDLLEDVRAAMSGLLAPEIVETVTGRAEIQKLFDLSSGKVAGSLVKEGKMVRNQAIRLMRGGVAVGAGKISGLKRFKEDVKEVDKGLECGILLDGIKDYKPGDIVEALTREERVRRITHV